MAVTYDFTGKTVFVSGSTKGIGLGITSNYLKSGANVLIGGRKKEDVDKVINDLSKKYSIDLLKEPKRIIGAVGDVSTKEGCDSVIKCIKDNYNGYIDVLVNNVGIFASKEFDEITDDEWLKFFNVNVMSGVRLSRYCIAKMLEPLSKEDEKEKEKEKQVSKIDTSDTNIKRRGGNIVFISSESGMRPLPNMIHYGMTKSAQISIARGLAQMCKGIPNVRVNSLMPGPTFTEGAETYLKGLPENKNLGDKFNLDEAKKNYIKLREPYSLKQNFLEVQEIANACLYLTSDAASGTNGHAMRCEGGVIYHM